MTDITCGPCDGEGVVGGGLHMLTKCHACNGTGVIMPCMQQVPRVEKSWERGLRKIEAGEETYRQMRGGDGVDKLKRWGREQLRISVLSVYDAAQALEQKAQALRAPDVMVEAQYAMSDMKAVLESLEEEK